MGGGLVRVIINLYSACTGSIHFSVVRLTSRSSTKISLCCCTSWLRESLSPKQFGCLCRLRPPSSKMVCSPTSHLLCCSLRQAHTQAASCQVSPVVSVSASVSFSVSATAPASAVGQGKRGARWVTRTRRLFSILLSQGGALRGLPTQSNS